MFNRHVQIKVAKTKPNTEEHNFEERIKTTSDLITNLMWKSSKFVAGYIILDTCLKVLIIMAKKA